MDVRPGRVVFSAVLVASAVTLVGLTAPASAEEGAVRRLHIHKTVVKYSPGLTMKCHGRFIDSKARAVSIFDDHAFEPGHPQDYWVRKPHSKAWKVLNRSDYSTYPSPKANPYDGGWGFGVKVGKKVGTYKFRGTNAEGHVLGRTYTIKVKKRMLSRAPIVLNHACGGY